MTTIRLLGGAGLQACVKDPRGARTAWQMPALPKAAFRETGNGKRETSAAAWQMPALPKAALRETENGKRETSGRMANAATLTPTLSYLLT